MLEAERSRVRFSIMSLDFSIDVRVLRKLAPPNVILKERTSICGRRHYGETEETHEQLPSRVLVRWSLDWKPELILPTDGAESPLKCSYLPVSWPNSLPIITEPTEQAGIVVTPSTCIWRYWVQVSAEKTVIQTEVFRLFQTNDGTVSQTGPQPLPSVSIIYWYIRYREINHKTSLNKLGFISLVTDVRNRNILITRFSHMHTFQ
jgi:hypothetical protein